MINKIIKYQGNENYICILCENDKKELCVVYATTDGLKIENNRDEINNYSGLHKIITTINTIDCNIKIPIIPTKHSIFSLIAINNEKEYEIICEVVKSLT